MDLFFRKRGQGPAVILLHGLFGSNDNQGGIARALQDDYTVYGVDLRNHGKSPHIDHMGYDAMAEDILRLMDQQQLDHAYFIGHSMGGKTAMQVALNAPRRVRKLCVLDIAPVTYEHHHTEIIKGLRAATQQNVTSRTEVMRILSAYEPEPAIQSFLAANWRRDDKGKFSNRLNLDILEKDYDKIIAGNIGTAFEKETLFVRGGNSDYILPHHKEAVLNYFPKATVRSVEGAGHWLHAEKPAMVQRIVKRFLDN